VAAAAGDQHRALPAPRQQWPNLRLVGGIVGHHQHPPPRQPRAICPRARREIARDLLGPGAQRSLAGTERASQLRDQPVQSGHRGRRRSLAPYQLNQRLPRDHAPRPQQQRRRQRPLAGAAQTHRAFPHKRLDRAQQTVLHVLRHDSVDNRPVAPARVRRSRRSCGTATATAGHAARPKRLAVRHMKPLIGSDVRGHKTPGAVTYPQR
jgi:hypothetical protein